MKRSIGISVISLAIALAPLGGCEVNPATGERQFIIVPREQVLAMGAAAKPDLIREYGGQVESPQLRKYVTTVGQRLVRHVEPEYRDLEWEFVTLDSDVLNAFALPGGKVFVSRGMLERLDNEAQLAAVLGHEIGHVTARHVDERVSQAMALDLGLQLGAGMTESDLALAAAELFGQGYLLSFSRDQELQADSLGLRYMAQAGYDPRGMVQLLRILVDDSQSGQPLEILSTHPNPQRRLRDVQEEIQKRYGDTLNRRQYRTFEGRFQRQAVPHLRSSRASPPELQQRISRPAPRLGLIGGASCGSCGKRLVDTDRPLSRSRIKLSRD